MPDWNSEPPQGAPMVKVPWMGPFYPPSAAAKGKTPSPPSDVFIALKRVCGHIGCWPWDPEGYSTNFTDDFAHGSSRGVGIAGLQKWAKIEPTGYIGLSTWNFCRSVLIQDWKPQADTHAFDAYSVDLVNKVAAAVTPPQPPPPTPTTGPRDRLAAHFTPRLGYTEQPAGSNDDLRPDGIRKAQDLTAGNGTWLRKQPWCGCWCFYALASVGVTDLGSWMASVYQIEERARAKKPPFIGFTTDRSKVRLGDLVIIGGRAVHVGTVRGFNGSYTLTWEGNTSSGSVGSQSNGGGSFQRSRSPNEVYGYALVKYPGE